MANAAVIACGRREAASRKVSSQAQTSSQPRTSKSPSQDTSPLTPGIDAPSLASPCDSSVDDPDFGLLLSSWIFMVGLPVSKCWYFSKQRANDPNGRLITAHTSHPPYRCHLSAHSVLGDLGLAVFAEMLPDPWLALFAEIDGGSG